MSENEKMSLVNIKDGAAIELFDNALEKVIENIHDINTTVDAREITLKITVKPLDENRNVIVYGVKCSSKLSGQEALKGVADITIEKGRLIAVCRKERQERLPLNVTAMKGKDQ